MYDPYALFQSRQLVNGLDVHVLHLPERSWACIGTVIYAGAYHDPHEKEGVAHMLEHLMAKYRAEPASVAARQRHLEDRGLVSTGFMTGGGGIIVSMKVIPEADVRTAIATMGEYVFDPLPWSRFEAERAVIEQEFQRSFGNRLAYEIPLWRYRALAPASRWARTPSALGSLTSIRSLTQGDVQAFRDHFSVPSNMAIVAVGRYSLEQVCVALEETPYAFPSQPQRTQPEARFVHVPELPLEPGRDVLFSQYGLESIMESDQCEYSTHAILPDTVSLGARRLLIERLQQELFEELRGVRAWTYGVGVDVAHTGIGGRMLSMHPEVLKLDAYDLVADSIPRAIERVVEDTAAFERVRLRKIRRLLMSDFTLHDDLFLGALKDLAHDRRIPTVKEEREQLEAVTHAEMADATKWLAPERRWTLRARR